MIAFPRGRLKRLPSAWQVEDFVSKASATQRRGRAGRVQPGTRFALYTRHRFERMRAFQVGAGLLEY